MLFFLLVDSKLLEKFQNKNGIRIQINSCNWIKDEEENVICNLRKNYK